MKLFDWFGARWFRFIHGNNLVYNTCWEDPRLDRVALEISPDDTLMVITSAGCNTLDYALAGPNRIHAVDMNPRQNALLELKIAGIRRLEFDDFSQMFGQGVLPNARRIYEQTLARELSPEARRYWDRRIDFFRGPRLRPSFYFHGSSGLLARSVNFYIDKIARIRGDITDALDASSLAEQQEIYHARLRDRFWRPYLRWLVRRDATLAVVGVPKPQRVQVEQDYEGGISRFVEDCLEAVFAHLPIQDNYFWRVYLTGKYTPECCPEYLKEENFQKLKAGRVDCISTHTSSILDFLRGFQGQISRYILLDHMDWMSTNHFPVLCSEWQAIVDRAAPRTRIIYRSGGLRADFVDRVELGSNGHRTCVGDLLQYNRPLAQELHALDRVHTYGSFHIADLVRS